MKPWIFCFVLLVLPVCICVAAPNLSDAMKSASSGDKTPFSGTRSDDSDDSDYCDDDDDDDFLGSIVTDVAMGILAGLHGASYYKDDAYSLQLPLDAGYVIPFDDNIRSMTRYSIIPLSVENEGTLFGFYLNGGTVDFKSGSLPDSATRGAYTVGLGVAYRYYLVGPERLLNPYVTTQLGWQVLYWNYRNPIIGGGGNAISDDDLNAFDGYVGLGLAVKRDAYFSFYTEVGFGGTFFACETYEGFNNDVFNNFGYFAVKAGLSIKF